MPDGRSPMPGTLNSVSMNMEWFENDDFWRDFYPFMFAEERFAATPIGGLVRGFDQLLFSK